MKIIVVFQCAHVQRRGILAEFMAGRHTLAVMPTGAGKSLCYQLPAVVREGTALVISPLIALMHDQIRSAEAIGIRAASLTSADANRDQTIQSFRAGELDLLYVAPERATTESFRRLVDRAHLSLIAIDEAHCVSEWGHDFRPDYRQLRSLLEEHREVPRLALTATADARTRADILCQLGIPEEGLIVAGFDRPNIRYHGRMPLFRQRLREGRNPMPYCSRLSSACRRRSRRPRSPNIAGRVPHRRNGPDGERPIFWLRPGPARLHDKEIGVGR